MSNVTCLLPVAQGVAVYAALRNHAKTLRAEGDTRTLSQIMADTFYTRITGQETSVGGVEIQLVMNERTLLRGSHEPAYAPGYGTIPASLARGIIGEADKTWLRRLYTAPGSGELVADGQQAPYLPRQAPRPDGPPGTRPAARLGATPPSPMSTTSGATRRGGRRRPRSNGQGLCEACNYTKEAPGWRADLVTSAGPL